MTERQCEEYDADRNPEVRNLSGGGVRVYVDSQETENEPEE